MANNYLEFSEEISLLTDQELAWFDKEEERQAKLRDEDSDDCCYDYEVDAERRFVWFHGDESGNPNTVADLVQRFLKDNRPNSFFMLTWSETCSKPRLGEFGGGAVFVTADEQQWMSVYQWVEDLAQKATHKGMKNS